jgi:glyoxylase-like metal-dependent hydrolase (beta-lactamase superfamily II)
MRELAPGVRQLGALIPNVINTYLLGDVLVDAGARFDARRILKELRGHDVRAHALTHAHPDHQGSSHRVCTELGIPYWVGEADADAAETPRLIGERQPGHPIAQASYRLFTGPGHPVDRRLRAGDEVGGFTVLDTPGHSLGHIAFWRESDRVLVLGDVLCNMDTLTLLPGLQLPKDFYTPDPARNRESAKALGPLRPELVCFGHGRPLRDPAKFEAFCASL